MKKETTDILLLFSTISSEKEKVNEIYINRIKKTKAYKFVQSLDNYLFISKKGKQLAADMKKIDFNKNSVLELQKEYKKLEQMYTTFHRLVNTSRQKIQNQQFEIDIISKDDFHHLKQSNPGLYHKIQIVKDHQSGTIAEAFRNYLKTHRSKEVANEYERLRTAEMEKEDEKRFDLFRWGGAGIGAVLFIFIMKLLLPVTLIVELSVIGLAFIIFFIGLRRGNKYLNVYSQIFLIPYFLAIIFLPILQEFQLLPESFHFEKLREYHLYLLSGLLGGLCGMAAGENINFIPYNKPLRLPNVFRFIEGRNRLLIVSLLLFASIWTLAFKENMTVYQYAESKISELVSKKVGAVAGDVEIEAIGTIVITAKNVNVREEPTTKKDNVITVVPKGTVYNFYEVKKVDGDNWYYIYEHESGQMAWVHGSTVKEE